MRFSVTLFDFVVLLGIIQGIFMTIVLYATSENSKQKITFSFILLILSLLSFKILLHTLKLWDTRSFRYFPLAIDTTLQPLFYLYIASITRKKIRPLYTFLFFTPTMLFMLYALVVYGLVLRRPNLSLEDCVANELYFNGVKTLEDWIALISAVSYWLLGYRDILRYRKWVYSTQSDTSLQELSWLKNLVLISGILVVSFCFVVVLDNFVYTGRHNFIHLQLFYCYLAFTTYYLSYKGYQLYGSSATVNTFVYKTNVNDLPEKKNDIKIDFEAIKPLIIQALENDKLYLNAELSLKELSQYINIPPASVSATINYCFEINFRSLINQYRVEEVKRHLSNPALHLSILGIALDCGFNSEASFYRIFRRHAGESPNSFMRKQKV